MVSFSASGQNRKTNWQLALRFCPLALKTPAAGEHMTGETPVLLRVSLRVVANQKLLCDKKGKRLYNWQI